MTGLPADNTVWPPASVSKQYQRMPLLQAWHAGERTQLQKVYGSAVTVVAGGPPTTINPQGTPTRNATAMSSTRTPFWTTTELAEEDTRRHYPVASSIARKSASLLFSEPLKYVVQGPVYETDGPPGADGKPQWAAGDPMPETLEAQARLELLLERCQFNDLLLQSAEIQAALGWIGLRVVYDQNGPIKDRPIIAREFAYATVPVYSWGQLVGVIFWRQLPSDGGSAVWRHLEYHSQGSVWHGLYKGDDQTLGTRYYDLAAHPATARLAELVTPGTDPDTSGRIEIVPDAVTAVSVPNLLPDPLDYENNAGRSDYSPEVIEVMEAADKVFTDMMDAEDDAKSRLLVPSSMLTSGRAGEGRGFNLRQRVFTTLNVPPSEKEGGGLAIEKVQFDMRAEEYRGQLDALKRDAIEAAGYNPRNDKGSDGRDVTATEVRSDDDADLAMRDTKIGYWRPRLNELLTGLLAVDVAKFHPTDPKSGKAIQAYPVVVEFPEAIQPSGEELAAEAKARKDAGAISTLQAVRDTRPGWTAQQVEEEVNRIESATQAVDPVTLGAQTGNQFGPGDGL